MSHNDIALFISGILAIVTVTFIGYSLSAPRKRR